VVTDEPPTAVVLGSDPRAEALEASGDGALPSGPVSSSSLGGGGAPWVGLVIGARRMARCLLLTRFL